MIIGEKKLKQLKRMPYIETRVSKSKDGKWVINKTTITSIRPVEYFQTILNGVGEEEVSVSEELEHELAQAKEVLQEE